MGDFLKFMKCHSQASLIATCSCVWTPHLRISLRVLTRLLMGRWNGDDADALHAAFPPTSPPFSAMAFSTGGKASCGEGKNWGHRKPCSSYHLRYGYALFVDYSIYRIIYDGNALMLLNGLGTYRLHVTITSLDFTRAISTSTILRQGRRHSNNGQTNSNPCNEERFVSNYCQ